MDARTKPPLYLILPVLLVALGAAPVYAIACPIVCAMGASARAGARMSAREMMHCRGQHCPMCNSSRKSSSNDPRSGEGSSCVGHYLTFGFVIPPAITVHAQSTAGYTVAARASRAHDLSCSHANLSPSPPGLLRGQDISQFSSILRI